MENHMFVTAYTAYTAYTTCRPYTAYRACRAYTACTTYTAYTATCRARDHEGTIDPTKAQLPFIVIAND